MSELFDIPETPEPRLTTARRRLDAAQEDFNSYESDPKAMPLEVKREFIEAIAELARAERERVAR